MMRSFGPLVLVLATLLGSVSAATYVMMSDEALADQASLIVVGRVLTSQTGFSERCLTRYEVQVERVLKGELSQGQINVDVVGGQNRDGASLFVHGSPSFGSGERTLLFLLPGQDGAFNILHLLLGAFHEVRSGDQIFAVRDLSEGSEVSVPSVTSPAASAKLKQPRDFAAFADWLANRSQGLAIEPDYHVEKAADVLAPVSPFSVGNLFRYFTFDEGGSVEWFYPTAGLQGIAGGGQTEFIQALNAWNDDPGSNVNLTFGGTTDSTAGFTEDGIANVTPEDPNNEIPGAYNCQSGGTLGFGGGGTSAGAGFYRGQRWLKTGESNIVMNDNIACRLDDQDGSSFLAEVLAHELGHTLGLGHSCGQFIQCVPGSVRDNALMRALAHAGGRGAQLFADDVAGIRFLYTSFLGANVTFPQFVDGALPGLTVPQGGAQPNSTRFVLRNNGPEADVGQIRFFNQAGNPTQVPIGGVMRSSLNYNIPSFGAFDFSTDGTGNFQVGPVEVTSNLGADSVLEGSAVFTVLGFLTSVPNAPPGALHGVFTSVNSSESTGVALYNPDKNMAATLCIVLLDEDGNEEASTELTLDPGEQTAVFADRPALFQSFFTAGVVAAGFTGSLNIQVKDRKVASVVGLLQDRATGALTAVATSSTAFVP